MSSLPRGEPIGLYFTSDGVYQRCAAASRLSRRNWILHFRRRGAPAASRRGARRVARRPCRGGSNELHGARREGCQNSRCARAGRPRRRCGCRANPGTTNTGSPFPGGAAARIFGAAVTRASRSNSTRPSRRSSQGAVGASSRASNSGANEPSISIVPMTVGRPLLVEGIFHPRKSTFAAAWGCSSGASSALASIEKLIVPLDERSPGTRFPLADDRRPIDATVNVALIEGACNNLHRRRGCDRR